MCAVVLDEYKTGTFGMAILQVLQVFQLKELRFRRNGLISNHRLTESVVRDPDLEIKKLDVEIVTKGFQLDETLLEFHMHNKHDASIHRFFS